MKTVLFVPGYKEGLKSRQYDHLLLTIKKRGYRAKFIPINWTRTVIDDWVRELDQEYRKHEPEKTILAGFSFGAMTVFAAAADRNPSELWLCSLSPYFAEDLNRLTKSWLTFVGKRRVQAFSTLRFSKNARLIRCKTFIFVGNLEAIKYPLLLTRAKRAHKLISRSKLIYVPDCGHDVTHPNYIVSICSKIQSHRL
jgi:pimeloyl-ACP methyl ester carboxylesterase